MDCRKRRIDGFFLCWSRRKVRRNLESERGYLWGYLIEFYCVRIRCLEGKKWKQFNLGEKKMREEKQSKVLTLALLEYTYGLCLNFEVKSELHTLLW